MEEYVEFEVVGHLPKLNGYTLVGVLERLTTEDGSKDVLVRAVPGEVVPAHFRNADPEWCDHCRTRRYRTETFVVRRDIVLGGIEAGPIYKQVGRSCLRDFLGYPSVDTIIFSVLAYLESLKDMEETMGGGNYGVNLLYPLSFVLGLTWDAIADYGWVSRAKAETTSLGESTSDVVKAWIRELDSHREFKRRSRAMQYGPSELAQTRATDVLTWAREYFDSLTPQQRDELSSYEHDLSLFVKHDGCNDRHIGYVASLVPYYQRHMDDEARRQERANQPPSDFVGTPGARQMFLLRLTNLKDTSSQWGFSRVHSFVDDKGNKLTWFSSSGDLELPVNHWFMVKATVKKHETYRDTKYTYLTRLSVHQDLGESQP